MKAFELTWLDGRKEVVEGRNILDAFRRAGLGNSAVKDLGSYKQVSRVITEKTALKQKKETTTQPTLF